MKKLFGLLSAAVIAVAFTSCGGGSKTPEAVAEQFIKHVNKNEFADAQKLATGAAVETLKTLESLAGMSGDAAAAGKEVEVKDMKCETKEAEAKCTYTIDGTASDITLTKVEDEWKVSEFPKEGASSDDAEIEETTEETTDEVVEETEEAPKAE